MSLHHLHMSMLDHGLGMAAEGSNLLMLSEMGMAAGILDVGAFRGPSQSNYTRAP